MGNFHGRPSRAIALGERDARPYMTALMVIPRSSGSGFSLPPRVPVMSRAWDARAKRSAFTVGVLEAGSLSSKMVRGQAVGRAVVGGRGPASRAAAIGRLG